MDRQDRNLAASKIATPVTIASGFCLFAAGVVAACAVAYLQSVAKGHPWSDDYIFSLAIPVLFLPTVIWLFLVPKHFAYDQEVVTLTSRLGRTQTFAWSQLCHWGFVAGGILCLEFPGKPIQIALSFYTPISRQILWDFLRTKFPDQKTGIWIGPFGISLPWLRKRRP